MPPPHIYQRQAGPVVNTGQPHDWDWRSVAKPEDLVLESWSQGFVVGALLLMGCITIANIRRGVLLHKLILAEQMMALTHGTFCFMNYKGYGWYLSSTAALLYLSYILHNVVAWMKVKPFFHGKSTIFQPGFVKWTTRIYLTTLAMTVPVILFQISDNFRFFNGYGGWYTRLRPYEPLMRDFWWVFCCGILFYVISKSYGMGVTKIIKKSPRFGILFASIILALIFTGLDVAASIHSFIGSTDGINPFWKLSLVFKCLSDAILLDDFKTELKRLGVRRMKRDEKRRESFALTLDEDYAQDSDEEAAMNYSNGNLKGPTMNGARQNSVAEYRKKNSDLEDSEQVEFMSALQSNPSRLSSDRESRRQSMQEKPRVGSGGIPAAKLPRLFAAIKPGKKTKKHEDEEVARNDSIWSEQSEDEPTPAIQQTKRKKSMFQRKEDPVTDSIAYEDDALERARMEQQRTIAELKRRKNSVAPPNPGSVDSNTGLGPLPSPDTVERARQQKKKAANRDTFWDGIDDLDDDDSAPSSSSKSPEIKRD